MKCMRVLQIQLDTAKGGIESFLINVYKRIDRKRVQFDFIEYGYDERDFDHEFTELGAKIYKLPNRLKSPLKACRELKKIISENNYSVVHIHKNSLSDVSAIKICKKLNVPTVIIHSHNSSRDNKIVVLLHKINLKFLNLKKYEKFACSKKAGDWLFGDCDNITIVNNGIELDRFKFDLSIRKKIRNELDIDSCFVIGNIGRLSEQKNPIYLINLFHKLRKFIPNIKLLWVGDGELREELKKVVNDIGESENVIFTGRVNNPENYYQAMDLFVMPSLYEGFPIAAIEAQASGLPCLLADTITNEAYITENVKFLSLNDEVLWINTIIDFFNSKFVRKDQTLLMKNKGFDIQSTVDFLQKFYLKCQKKGGK